MTNDKSQCIAQIYFQLVPHIILSQPFGLNPRRGEIVKRSRTETVQKRDDDDDITPTKGCSRRAGT